MELDTATTLLCVVVSLAAGFVILLFLGSYATQLMADVATNTTKATTTRGFQVLQPAGASAQLALPVELQPTAAVVGDSDSGPTVQHRFPHRRDRA